MNNSTCPSYWDGFYDGIAEIAAFLRSGKTYSEFDFRWKNDETIEQEVFDLMDSLGKYQQLKDYLGDPT